MLLKRKNEIRELIEASNRAIISCLGDLKEEIKIKDFKREQVLENMLIDIKSKKIAEYENVLKKKQSEIEAQQEIIDKYVKESDKQAKAIETLKKENEILINQVKDLQSDRYLKIELPSDKPKKQKLGIKSGVKNSKANKMLKEISENNLKEKS